MGRDQSSRLPDLGGKSRRPATTRMRQRFAPVWSVLRHALSPAFRGAGGVVRTAVAVTTVIGLPIAGALAGLPVPWVVAAVGAGLAMLILRSAVHFYREAHPQFPRHDLRVKPLWHADLPNLVRGEETRVVFLPVEIVNREPNRRIILRFDVLWHRDDDRWRELSHFHGRSIEVTLPSPVKIAPQDHTEGVVAFDDPAFSWLFEYPGELMDVAVKDRYAVRLRVTDEVTGSTVERSIPERLRASST